MVRFTFLEVGLNRPFPNFNRLVQTHHEIEAKLDKEFCRSLLISAEGTSLNFVSQLLLLFVASCSGFDLVTFYENKSWPKSQIFILVHRDVGQQSLRMEAQVCTAVFPCVKMRHIIDIRRGQELLFLDFPKTKS